jgi:DNA-binding PadR family transcriptional regulator
MPSKGRTNPLALAVLSCLSQRPMHPYEIAATLREQGKDSSIKINYGSLYTVVESLLRRGLIAEKETVREGRRPERTVYALTTAGRAEHEDWLSELLSRPEAEFTQFEAALSLAGGLPPEEVRRQLEQRRTVLQMQVSGDQSALELCDQQGLPEVFTVELEYRLTMRKAELGFVEDLIGRIRNRKLGGIELWEAFHAAEDDEAARAAATAAAEQIMDRIAAGPAVAGSAVAGSAGGAASPAAGPPEPGSGASTEEARMPEK